MTATQDRPVAPRSPLGFAEVEQRRWLKWQLYLGFVGLFLGLLMGFLQAMERTGVDLYDEVQLESYWQGLTLHGVALAFVFTFAFANSFLSLTTIRGFERSLASTRLVQASLITAVLGVVLAAAAILLNKATVLFTFYSPLEANVAFYLGAVLLVVSTWITLLNQILTLRQWRADNPGTRIPLLAYVSIITFIMWGIASLGVAIETVVFIIPWSIGLVENTDPLLNRTLFWFTGHPIVYFWLLPAYVSWYMCIPKQVGGKLYSDAVVRGVFILFLLLSTPVGLHHQFTDPGVDEGLKLVHGVLTFGVFFPSMVTAFTLVAAMEDGARNNGGKGLVRWIGKLPWGNPSFVAQVLAMIGFALGGASGLINASATVNTVVHNTAFIPGHFHLTVGTAVALSIMGISYWLVPYLTGRKLFGRRLAVLQAWLWLIGVFTFSRGQMGGGLEGMPRRFYSSEVAYAEESWEFWNILTGVGGMIMFVSGLLFFVVILGTLRNKERVPLENLEMPVAETKYGSNVAPAILDRLGFWTIAAFVLILIAYIPVFVTHNYDFTSPGFRLF
jgi:cytochrome c oxidase subunit 1